MFVRVRVRKTCAQAHRSGEKHHIHNDITGVFRNLVAKKLVALNRSTRDHTLKATVTQIYSNFLTLTAHANVEKYPFYSLKKRI